jgi:protein-S-isoprenylcysteine O-methyltransferase Ste14
VRENVVKLGGWRRLGSAVEIPVQTGPYRYSRNPMYLAAALIWLGWIMLFGSLYLLVGLFLLFAGITAIGIPFEERQWEASLGEAYVQYKKQVARRLGRRKAP